jgi:hypothetical protein
VRIGSLDRLSHRRQLVDGLIKQRLLAKLGILVWKEETGSKGHIRGEERGNSRLEAIRTAKDVVDGERRENCRKRESDNLLCTARKNSYSESLAFFSIYL